MKAVDGIYTPDPVKNPVFAGYNRVRVEKCSFDRYMGRSEERGIAATAPDGTPFTFDAYHHGFFIMEATFRALADGLRYTTWQRGDPRARRRACCGAGAGDKLTPVDETLPPLRDAEAVLLIGHSNASHGLFHNVDNLAASLAALPGFHGDVRALFDENFLPSVENEAAFAVNAQANSDLYSGIWRGTSSGRGEPFSYDGEVYHATNDQRRAVRRARRAARRLVSGRARGRGDEVDVPRPDARALQPRRDAVHGAAGLYRSEPRSPRRAGRPLGALGQRRPTHRWVPPTHRSVPPTHR